MAAAKLTEGGKIHSCLKFHCKYILFLANLSILFIDIDECEANTHDCAAEADCKNTEGSFMCTCHDGYQGNGKTCQGTKIAK